MRIMNLYSCMMTLIFLIAGYQQTQAQDISFSNVVAPEIHVCEESEEFTVAFTNTSGFQMTNITINVAMPTGILYKAGSLNEVSSFNVLESNISDLANITFSMGNLDPNETVEFKIDLEARYDAIPYQQGGNVFRNTVTVDYTANGQTLDEDEITDPYNILIPALSITNVTKMLENVFVGQTFTRQVTIVNGGFGKLSSFTLHDEFDHSLLALITADKGVIDTTAGTISFTGLDFASVGNGDNYLDKNEAITVTETITAIGCTNEQSKLYATYGCDGQTSKSNNKFPTTDISLYAPNVVGIPTPSFNTCMDVNVANVQELMLINKGTGPANGLSVTVQQTEDNGFDKVVFSKIDHNNIEYKIGANGSYTVIAPTSTGNTNNTGNWSCLGSTAKGKFVLDLPNIQPDDTVFIKWDSYTCDAFNFCGEVDLIGWDYSFSYTDMCNSKNYSKTNQTGQAPKKKNFAVFAEYPSDMVDGQEEEFTFRLTSTSFDMPEGNNPYFEVELDIPVGLVYSGNSADLVFEGNNSTWTPSSVNYDTNTRTLIAQYPLPEPFTLLNSEVKLKLTADCNEPGAGAGNKSVTFQLFYIMDDACNPIYGCNSIFRF